MQIAKSARVLLALSPLLLPLMAHAGPNEYVLSPIVEQGEKEIEFKWGTEKHKDQPSGNATSLGFGLGVNSWWATELSAKWKREPGQSHGFDAAEWENRFQLTETGKYPVDVGFLLEVERPKDRAEGYEVTYGPLLQAEWGAVQGNLNLLWQKHVRASEPFETELHYQVQLKYRASEQFEWARRASVRSAAGTSGRRRPSRSTSSDRRYSARSSSPASRRSSTTRPFCLAPTMHRPRRRCGCRPSTSFKKMVVAAPA
jgi:hypothetical protein